MLIFYKRHCSFYFHLTNCHHHPEEFPKKSGLVVLPDSNRVGRFTYSQPRYSKVFWGAGVEIPLDYPTMRCYNFTISTRLFFAFPPSVLLSSVGFVCPQPFDESRNFSIPFKTIAFITALALFSESV